MSYLEASIRRQREIEARNQAMVKRPIEDPKRKAAEAPKSPLDGKPYTITYRGEGFFRVVRYDGKGNCKVIINQVAKTRNEADEMKWKWHADKMS